MKNANPVSRGLRAGLLLGVLVAGCSRQAGRAEPSVAPAPKAGPVAHYTYEVIQAWPHDPKAFTQGLLFRNDTLLESTGLNGESSLREVEWRTGRILKRIEIPRTYFAEGLAVIGAKAYQLTWQNHQGFIYDADTFQRLGEFAYDGEGWGLTTDGTLLILSDGTNRIRFLDPATFKIVRTIDVTADGQPVSQLNELELVRGEIFANVWQTDRVVRIDPANGRVLGEIDFSGLLSGADRLPTANVLNGIAYDAPNDRLIVTGKLWPKIFEVRIKPKP